MRLRIETGIRSPFFTSIDEKYQVFNGSHIKVGKLYEIWAMRAQAKPDLNLNGILPTFPYITVNGDWSAVDEYAALYIVDIQTSSYKFLKYKHLSTMPAEDPRLYKKKGDDIYMAYMALVIEGDICTKKNSSKVKFLNGVCYGMWEINLSKYIINASTTAPVLLCSWTNNINNETISIFEFYEHPIFKNWSYLQDQNVYIDALDNKINVFAPLNDEATLCKREHASVGTDTNLKFFVKNTWKIALTTPTTDYKSNLYGICHIRIQWKLISENYGSLNPLLKNIIKKNDVHHSDFYFMSIYKIEDNKWKLSKPFLITGDTTKDYYSYNINFPCGCYIESDLMNITWGLGDCILAESNIDMGSIDFFDREFDYSDLEVYEIQHDILKKSQIIKKLNYMDSYRYLLPKNMLLFDLGGSGLKVMSYTRGKLSDGYVNLGTWDDPSTLPNLNSILKKVGGIELNEFIFKGGCLLFSLADISKLWSQFIRKNPTTIQLFKDVNNHSVYNLFNIPRHITTLQMSDSLSHFYGNLWVYERFLNRQILIDQNVLSVAVGTGINTVWRHNEVKSKNPKPIWELKYKGVGIRDAFLSKFDYDEFLEMIQTLHSNIDIYRDIVIFSGGSAQNIVNYIISYYPNAFDVYMDTTLYILKQQPNIMFNINPASPYNGLVYGMLIERNIALPRFKN